MAQISHQSSLRPDSSGTFTKEAIEKAREEEDIEDIQYVVKVRDFISKIV
jgi:hypothetical protein